jgi:uncharacterized protein (TIGR02118 family)
VVKLVAFFKRRAGLSVEDFQRHWRTTHADLVVRQAGLRRYVQNHTLASGYRNGEPDYDGVAEAWFDDTQAMRALAPSPEYAAVRADETHFIDPASMGTLLTNEVVIVDGPVPEGAAKLIAFLRMRADVSVDFFQSHWRDHHGPLAARIPGNRRYVQCHARRGIYETERRPPFDGIPMSWFDDPDALRASGRSPEYAATRADEKNFMAPGRLPFVIVAEHEIELRPSEADAARSSPS